MNRRRPRRAERGFTLIELLMVALVAVLLIGGALPTSVRRYQRLQLERYARQLRLAAKYARLYAVETNQACHLVLDEGSRSFMVVARLSDDGAETIVSNPYVRPCQMEERYTFEKIVIMPAGGESVSSDETRSVVVFRPDGTADTAVIQIGDGAHQYSVSILGATGKAKVQRGRVEEVPLDVIDLDATGGVG